MLPQIPVIRLADAQKAPLPSYTDAVGTCMVLRANTDGVKIDPNCSEIFLHKMAISFIPSLELLILSSKSTIFLSNLFKL